MIISISDCSMVIPIFVLAAVRLETRLNEKIHVEFIFNKINSKVEANIL